VSAMRLPERGNRCFDQLPATVERLLTGTTAGPALDEPLLHERFARVALIYLDAFGWTFLDRQRSRRHALLDRVASDGVLAQLTSQFPSTTAAHATTIHSGLPVAEHGVYEWHVLEPSLNRLITPLLFSFSGDGRRESLAGVLAPESVYPRESLYARLAEHGVRSSVAQSAAYARGSPNGVLLRGADVLPFSRARQGLAAAAAALAAADVGYAMVYLDDVDSLMHHDGPDGPAADAAFATALTLVDQTPFPAGTLVLLTADHGMSPVDPGRTVYVNEVWPELAGQLETGADGKPLAPAGSCRDLFLHVRDGKTREVCDQLAERLDGVADVMEVDALVACGAFDTPSTRLQARLGEVVVLPRYGEAVFWHEPGRFAQELHGQHGGLSPQEMEIPLLAWVAT
jgi:Type I phosphodiesterase / nucleotide pyrophosphatase